MYFHTNCFFLSEQIKSNLTRRTIINPLTQNNIKTFWARRCKIKESWMKIVMIIFSNSQLTGIVAGELWFRLKSYLKQISTLWNWNSELFVLHFTQCYVINAPVNYTTQLWFRLVTVCSIYGVIGPHETSLFFVSRNLNTSAFQRQIGSEKE